MKEGNGITNMGSSRIRVRTLVGTARHLWIIIFDKSYRLESLLQHESTYTIRIDWVVVNNRSPERYKSMVIAHTAVSNPMLSSYASPGTDHS